MPGGVDDDPDDFRAPLPRDDRVWIHPSELRTSAPSATPPPRRRGRQALAVGVVALAGSAIAVVVADQALELSTGDASSTARPVSMSTISSTIPPEASLVAWWGMEVADSADGVVVTSCAADGRAATAGLTAGDLIVRVGGLAVGDHEELAAALATVRRGVRTSTDVTFELRRSGRSVTVTMPLLEATAER
jgi:S1-C subfamily serine protease